MKLTFKRIIAAFVFTLFFSNISRSQVTFTSWVHYPYITLYASAAGAGVSTSAGVSMDDIYSALHPLGFTFNFYGIPYTQCVIGANGSIAFDTSLAGNYDPWPISQALLGNTEVYNSILGPWCDMDQADFGGEINYFVTGIAPNRVFGANFCHNGMFNSSSCTGEYTTSQILLYETSNVAEVHIAHKTVCTAWNTGRAIVGIQNATGTAAAVAPGRDYPSTWTATNESWRFTPDTGSSYLVDSIAYAPIPYYTIYWYDSVSGAFLGSGDSIVLSPSGPTTYAAIAKTCNDSTSTGLDTGAVGYMTLMPLTNGMGAVPLTTNFCLYPNPAHNVLFVTSKESVKHIVIINLLGQVVHDEISNTNGFEVNTVNLPSGVYFIKINDTIIKKFMKE